MITLALVLARAAMWPISSITGLLLIDIANTFNQSVSVMGQIRTVGSLVGVVFALIMGVLSVRYNHKTLLVSGMILIALSAIGCWMSPSFLFILLAYPLTEIGMSMTRPMTFSLVGQHLPREERSSAISFMMTGIALISIVGGFFTNYLNGIGGWRFAYLGFPFPLALIAAFFAYVSIPTSEVEAGSSSSSSGLLSGFSQVFSHRSATACLLGQAIAMFSWGGMGVYYSSFFRQEFGISIGTVVVIGVFMGLAYIGGNLFAGRFANTFGCKRLAVIALLMSGLLFLLIVYMRIFWMAGLVMGVFAFFGGIRATSINGLTLDQIPGARGTLMSLNSAAQSLGTGIGAAVGGFLLVSYSYSGLYLGYGVVFLLGSLVLSFLTSEP